MRLFPCLVDQPTAHENGNRSCNAGSPCSVPPVACSHEVKSSGDAAFFWSIPAVHLLASKRMLM